MGTNDLFRRSSRNSAIQQFMRNTRKSKVSENFFNEPESPKNCHRRIMAQAPNILRSLVDAYNTGALDDPQAAARLCLLFALVAEGKVKGSFDKETCTTKWSLEENHYKKLEQAYDAILASKL
jgi:hypothetical protein